MQNDPRFPTLLLGPILCDMNPKHNNDDANLAWSLCNVVARHIRMFLNCSIDWLTVCLTCYSQIVVGGETGRGFVTLSGLVRPHNSSHDHGLCCCYRLWWWCLVAVARAAARLPNEDQTQQCTAVQTTDRQHNHQSSPHMEISLHFWKRGPLEV